MLRAMPCCSLRMHSACVAGLGECNALVATLRAELAALKSGGASLGEADTSRSAEEPDGFTVIPENSGPVRLQQCVERVATLPSVATQCNTLH